MITILITNNYCHRGAKTGGDKYFVVVQDGKKCLDLGGGGDSGIYVRNTKARPKEMACSGVLKLPEENMINILLITYWTIWHARRIIHEDSLQSLLSTLFCRAISG